MIWFLGQIYPGKAVCVLGIYAIVVVPQAAYSLYYSLVEIVGEVQRLGRVDD